MKAATLAKGAVVQLGPTTANPAFRYCLMIVTDPRDWGAQGYVQTLGVERQPGGVAYYRAEWDEMEFVGRAHWVAEEP